MSSVIGGVVTLVTCVLLMPLTMRLSNTIDALDRPGHRTLHDVPTPRLGGIAVAISCLVGLGVSLPLSERGTAVWLFPIALAVLGLAEDLRGVAVIYRLPTQVALAILVSPLLMTGLTGPLAWKALFFVGTVVWLVSYTNAFNFMDGINGISAVQAILAGTGYAFVGYVQQERALLTGGVVLVGAMIGFLPFNFPASRTFLGDAGSYLVGAWLGVLLLLGVRANQPVELMIAPVLLYLIDTGWTLLRRAHAGEKLFEPHRQHVYQRLVLEGWSHLRTTLTVGLFISAMILLACTASLESWLGRALGLAGIGGLCLLYLNLPRLVSRTEVSA